MNIAIVSPGPFSVPPVNGSSVEHDIDQVSRVLAQDHLVYIYTRTCRAYPRSEREGNLHYIRVPYRGARHYLKQVIQDLRERQVDALLVENRPAFVPSLRRSFPHMPIVVNMHSHVFASPASIAPSRMRKAVREMDGMITNSRYLRRFFIERHRVPEDCIDAVHLGIDPSRYHPHDEDVGRQLRNQLGLRADHRVLFYAGRLIPAKGVHLLLKTFRSVASRDQKARLVIVGGTGYGSNRQNAYVRTLKRLAEPLGSRVKFVKFVPTKHMPKWYQMADVVATPSLWAEPFCRVNLEAMASGKPVLTTHRGGIPEVVEHGRTGYCLSPSEWVRKVPKLWNDLWKDPQVMRRMGEEAASRASRFSWEATARGYVAALEKAMHRRQAM